MGEARMTNNSVPNDPKFVWKSQETHQPSMTAEQVADLARKSEAKTLRMRFLFLAAFSLYMAVSLGARILSDETGPVPVLAGWIGLVRFALLIAWALTLRYYKKHEPISLFLNTGEFSGIDYYRRELLDQLDYFHSTHRWLPTLTLVVLFFIATVTVNPGLIVPLSLLFVIFAFGWYAQWKRSLPQLRSEIHAAEALRRDLDS
jgi:hypothetical protein